MQQLDDFLEQGQTYSDVSHLDNTYDNELRMEFFGMYGLNYSSKHNNCNRVIMSGTQLSQKVIPKFMTEKRIQTGLEQSWSKYVYNIQMPRGGTIREVIDRYPQNATSTIPFNPETLVIFEGDDGRFGCFSVKHYESKHQSFGFEYKPTQNLTNLRTGAHFPKGSVFMQAPTVSENGGYMGGGISMNTVFNSDKAGAEDGAYVSDTFVKLFSFCLWETRTFSYGSTHWPINLMGGNDKFQAWAEIGEYIREDGLIAAHRKYDTDTAPVRMSRIDVSTPDFDFDKLHYSRPGVGRVVDVKVISNHTPNKKLPPAMAAQAEKYALAYRRYCERILECEKRLKREYHRKYNVWDLPMTPELRYVLKEARAIVNYIPPSASGRSFNQPLILTYRKEPLDEYRVEMVIQYEVVPDLGFKITDGHGGKATLTRKAAPTETDENGQILDFKIKGVKRDCDMPVDKDGNQAHIVLEAGACSHRMIMGRLREHANACAARDISKQVCYIMGLEPPRMENYHLPKTPTRSYQDIASIDKERLRAAWRHLMEFYNIWLDEQFEFFRKLKIEEKIEHLVDIANDGIYLKANIHEHRDPQLVALEIKKRFNLTYDVVTFRGEDGIVKKSKRKMLVGPLHIYLLNKITDDYSAVSTARLQHYGVPSPITRSEKFSKPWRDSPIRSMGETEGRVFNGYAGAEAAAEMIDRTNNHAAQREVSRMLLTHATPGKIERIVDRDKIEIGQGCPLQMLNAVTATVGFEQVWVPEIIDDKTEKK